MGASKEFFSFVKSQRNSLMIKREIARSNQIRGIQHVLWKNKHVIICSFTDNRWNQSVTVLQQKTAIVNNINFIKVSDISDNKMLMWQFFMLQQLIPGKKLDLSSIFNIFLSNDCLVDFFLRGGWYIFQAKCFLNIFFLKLQQIL